jgi:hypothetical protein
LRHGRNTCARQEGGELVAGHADGGAVDFFRAQLVVHGNRAYIERGDGDVGGDEVVGEPGDGRFKGCELLVELLDGFDDVGEAWDWRATRSLICSIICFRSMTLLM